MLYPAITNKIVYGKLVGNTYLDCDGTITNEPVRLTVQQFKTSIKKYFERTYKYLNDVKTIYVQRHNEGCLISDKIIESTEITAVKYFYNNGGILGKVYEKLGITLDANDLTIETKLHSFVCNFSVIVSVFMITFMFMFILYLILTVLI